MCLIAVAWQRHARLSLVVAANRDEFHDRPSLALAPWRDAPGVLAGRDERAGGTWLGVAAGGRFAAVTNFREAQVDIAPRSRGALVADFLSGRLSAEAYAERTRAVAHEYGPFNLLVCDGAQLVCLSNRPKATWTRLAPGLHGISNGPLDAPWPKTRFLVDAVAQWTRDADPREDDAAAGAALFTALSRQQPFPDAELPDTGVGIGTERRLSPPFINGELYGTRSSTVVWMGAGGAGEILEHRFGASAKALGQTRLRIAGD